MPGTGIVADPAESSVAPGADAVALAVHHATVVLLDESSERATAEIAIGAVRPVARHPSPEDVTADVAKSEAGLLPYASHG